MPDLMKSNLYSRTMDSGSSLPHRNEIATRILLLFDEVFGKCSDAISNESDGGVPVATFVEFVRVHLSSKWASMVEDFISSGYISISAQMENGIPQRDKFENFETAEYEMKQCIGVLIPLGIENANGAIANYGVKHDNQLLPSRLLTFDKERCLNILRFLL